MSDFYVHKRMADGHLNICKECVKERVAKNKKGYSWADDAYDKSEKGVIRVIYKTQKRNSKLRGMSPPPYTKDELEAWLYKHGFKKLYDEWVESGYIKDKKPSVDRLDDFKPYLFDNIRLVTWRKNRQKQYNDTLNANGTSGKKCKAVRQYSKDGELIAEFISAAASARSTGIDVRGISRAATGRTKTSGGFVWKYIRSSSDR